MRSPIGIRVWYWLWCLLGLAAASRIPVNEKPRIVTAPTDIGVISGQQALFVCLVEGNPAPTITWTVANSDQLEPRFQTPERVPRGSVLRLSSALMRDDGTLVTCRASNVLGMVDASARITVYRDEASVPAGYPRFINKFSVFVAKKNDKVTLECRAEGNPLPTVVWFKDSIPVDPTNPRLKLLIEGSLHISKTLEEDEGKYECVASNTFGSRVSPGENLMVRDDMDAALQLLMRSVKRFRPHFTSTPRDQEVAPGSQVILICSAVGAPMPSVSWFRGTTQIPSLPGQPPGTTKVILSDLSESINCTCLARSEVGSINHTVQVVVKEIPLPPEKLQVARVTSEQAVAEWQPSSSPEVNRYIVFWTMGHGRQETAKSKSVPQGGVLSVTLDTLLPFTNYSAWVVAASTNGLSPPTPRVYFVTSELPPSSPPLKIRITAISNAAVSVTWQPPSEPNGRILSYRVYYTEHPDRALAYWDKFLVEVQSNTEDWLPSAMLTHLNTNSTYHISVSAVNSQGEGPVSDQYPVIVRAGVLPRPRNYRAVVNSAHEIMLSWDPPDPSTTSQIIRYRLVYSPLVDQSQQIDTGPASSRESMEDIAPDRRQSVVRSLRPNTLYRFELAAVTAAGLGVVATVEAKTKEFATQIAPSDIRLESLTPYSMQVCWLPPSASGGRGHSNTTYEIRIQPIKTARRQPLRKEETVVLSSNIRKPASVCHVVKGLDPWTRYAVRIAVAKSVGLGPFSEMVEAQTLETVPGAPVGVNIRPLSSTQLEVVWTRPQIDKAEVMYYNLVHFPLNSNGQPAGQERRVQVNIPVGRTTVPTGEDYREVLAGLQPDTSYQVMVYAVSRVGRGELAKTDPVRTYPRPPGQSQHLKLSVRKQDDRPVVVAKWAAPVDGPERVIGYRVSWSSIAMRTIDGHNAPPPSAPDASLTLSGERNVSGRSLELEPGELHLGHTYEFKVAALSNSEAGPEISATVQMPEGAPTASPTELRLLDSAAGTGPTSVTLMWEPPPSSYRNGRLTHYEARCYVVDDEEGTETRHNVTTTSLALNGLKEQANYACLVRASTGGGPGPWTSPLYFKTKRNALPPPEEIRAVRLSQSNLKVTWKMPVDMLSRYAGFVVYYSLRDVPADRNAWHKYTTGTPVTLVTLTDLQPATEYVVRVSSVSASGVEGQWSAPVVQRKSMIPPSQPTSSERVNQLTCRSDGARNLMLNWEPITPAKGDVILHYRVNFTGVTQYRGASGEMQRKVRAEREQSMGVADLGRSVLYRVNGLAPYTDYRVGVEPVFGAKSEGVGRVTEVACSTHADRPAEIPAPSQTSMDRAQGTITIHIRRPSEENGPIYRYLVIVSPYQPQQALPTPEKLSEIQLARNRDMPSSQAPYLALVAGPDRLFSGGKVDRFVVLGEASKNNWDTSSGASSKLLVKGYEYVAALRACVKLNTGKENCRTSPWSARLTTERPVAQQDSSSPPGAGSVGNNHLSSRSSDPTNTSGGVTRINWTGAMAGMVVGLCVLAGAACGLVCVIRRRQGMQRGHGGGPAGAGDLGGKPGNTRINGSLGSSGKRSADTLLAKEPLLHPSSCAAVNQQYSCLSTLQDPVEMARLNYPTPDLLANSLYGQSRLISATTASHPPIPIHLLPDQVAHLKSDDCRLFSEEYESIDPGQQFTWEHSNLDINKGKNRYANVIAYDHSRVILQPLDNIPGSDYINANYMDGYRKQNAYIATQGPLPETTNDFWRMVWEQRSSTVVMMTRLEERSRVKCDQYWPAGSRGSTASYHLITVTTLDCTELAYYTLRTFALQRAGCSEKREIRQLQFTAWPDHGVPSHPAPLLMFLRRVRSEDPPDAGPVIVHCSAGVGRTGAFIVIDAMLERIRHEKSVDVYGHVTALRAQRNYIVQTEDQYVFIHDALLEAIESGNTEVPARSLYAHLQKLGQLEAGCQATGLELEFKSLVNQPRPAPELMETANFPVNQRKNRLVNILPLEMTRVMLRPIRGVEGSDYINASLIDGYRSRGSYIATQGPLSDTTEDFWRMLWETNSTIIVMLTRLREMGRDKCYQYWPTERSARYQYFVVDPVAEYNMTHFILREFKVTDARDGQSRTVRQFHFTDWPEQGVPATGDSFIDFIGQVHKTKDQFGQDGPITVHCSAGAGRTGVFLALSLVLDRMRFEGVIDMYQTVKLLRWQRPGLVQSEDQYQFCYAAALEYLNSFDHYAT